MREIDEFERLYALRTKRLDTLIKSTAKKYLKIYDDIDLIEDGNDEGYIEGFLDDIKKEVGKLVV